MLPGLLAQRLGIEQLVDQTVRLGDRAEGANAGRKVMTMVSAMGLGADCIEDCDILRSGQTAAVLGHRVAAPSTLGTFLRAFTFGHVRQLDRVLADSLTRAWAVGAGPGAERLIVDVDSFVGEVHGYDKQAAGFGYTHKRGYHPILATRAGTGEVLHIRCRKGSANTARGALRFVEELIPRVARAGATHAGEGTRTPKALRPPGPKPGVSASSTTPAGNPVIMAHRDLRQRRPSPGMFATAMADDIVIEHPNREKASSKLVKLIVVAFLLASAVLVTIVTVGGWDALAGGLVLQLAYIVLYVVMAFFVARWNRGVLPVAAALAIIMLIFAAVSGPEWFDRAKDGFTDPALDADLLGLLTLIIVPVQALLIAFAMKGFSQGWNIEVERLDDGTTRAV